MMAIFLHETEDAHDLFDDSSSREDKPRGEEQKNLWDFVSECNKNHLAADAEDRNSKNRRRRRRLFKTFIVQDVTTDAVLSPGLQLIIDAAPSNRRKKNLSRQRDILH